MQFVVRSGPASRPTAAGSTPIAAGNMLIDSGSTLIGPRDSFAKPEDFGRGRKREQQKTIQTMGIRVRGSKLYHDHGNHHAQILVHHPYSLPYSRTELRRGFLPLSNRDTIGHWHHHRNPDAPSDVRL